MITGLPVISAMATYPMRVISAGHTSATSGRHTVARSGHLRSSTVNFRTVGHPASPALLTVPAGGPWFQQYEPRSDHRRTAHRPW
jgi:hypothetical protein